MSRLIASAASITGLIMNVKEGLKQRKQENAILFLEWETTMSLVGQLESPLH